MTKFGQNNPFLFTVYIGLALALNLNFSCTIAILADL